MVSKAYCIPWLKRISTGWPLANACGQRDSITRKIWTRPRTGIHRSICGWVLATRFRQMGTLEKYTKQRGKRFFVETTKIYCRRAWNSFVFFFRTKKHFQILTGNINTYSEVENFLQPIIIASKIRIYPYSQYDRTVCLRVELVGCVWNGKFRKLINSFFPLFVSCFNQSWTRKKSIHIHNRKKNNSLKETSVALLIIIFLLLCWWHGH